MDFKKLLRWTSLNPPDAGRIFPPTIPPRPKAVIPFVEMQEMALAVAKSGMFGVRDESQALSLMLLCHAEGLHPILALRRYHIIEGKPSMRSDALQGEFEQSGGVILWHERNEQRCSATFFRDKRQATAEAQERAFERYRRIQEGKNIADLARIGEMTIVRTLADAIEKKLAVSYKDSRWQMKKNWEQSPRQMLHARCLSEGVRAVHPGLIAGIYVEDEAFDFPEPETMTAEDRVKQATQNRIGDAPLHWEDEVVHFGKNMKGKRLGDLDPGQLGWLQKDWKPSSNPSAQDLHLKHVLQTMHSVGEEVTEDNYSQIVCHVGKAQGPMLGKTVTEIPVAILQWLHDHYGEGEGIRWGTSGNEKDKRFKQAVDITLSKLE